MQAENYNWQSDMFEWYTIDKLLNVEAVRTRVCNTCSKKRKAKAPSKLLLPFETRPQGPVRNLCGCAVCTLHARTSNRDTEILTRVA